MALSARRMGYGGVAKLAGEAGGRRRIEAEGRGTGRRGQGSGEACQGVERVFSSRGWQIVEVETGVTVRSDRRQNECSMVSPYPLFERIGRRIGADVGDRGARIGTMEGTDGRIGG